MIKVNETEFEVKKLDANGMAKFANIIGKTTLEGRKVLRAANTDANDMLWAILSGISGDSLAELGSLLLGCDKKFASENFDLNWVLEALEEQMKLIDLQAILKRFLSIATQVAN